MGRAHGIGPKTCENRLLRESYYSDLRSCTQYEMNLCGRYWRSLTFLDYNFVQVLLLDEPTSALDPISTRHIEESVLELKRTTGLTIIMVSHSLEQVKRMADYICLVVAGELLEVLKPTELDNATHPRAVEYLQAAQQH